MCKADWGSWTPENPFDLNQWKTFSYSGGYRIMSVDYASWNYYINAPENAVHAGNFVLFPGAFLYQFYLEYIVNTANRIWVRSYYSGWTSWRKISTCVAGSCSSDTVGYLAVSSPNNEYSFALKMTDTYTAVTLNGTELYRFVNQT